MAAALMKQATSSSQNSRLRSFWGIRILRMPVGGVPVATGGPVTSLNGVLQSLHDQHRLGERAGADGLLDPLLIVRAQL